MVQLRPPVLLGHHEAGEPGPPEGPGGGLGRNDGNAEVVGVGGQLRGQVPRLACDGVGPGQGGEVATVARSQAGALMSCKKPPRSVTPATARR